MGVVIDTSALVALERAGRPALPNSLLKETLVMPSIVWAEVGVGIRRAGSPERKALREEYYKRLLASMRLMPFTKEMAEHFADIRVELIAKGIMIPPTDIIIAATARCLNCSVLVGTSGEKHFSRVSHLKLLVLPEG